MTAKNARNLKRDDRRDAIAQAVMEHGALRIEDLAARFDISLMTVHRDLDELVERGILRKSRGVATALASTLVESSIVYRQGQRLATKRAMAATALEYVEAGQSVFLDDSTTVLQIVPLLRERTPLTVITNSLFVVNEVGTMPRISLIALGGTFHNWCGSFMGRMTNDAIHKLRGDVLIMSAPAITDGTLYFQAPETVDTKRAMLDAAGTKILLVDHTKFKGRALHALADLSEFDVVIVDAGMSEAEISALRAEGINIVVAPAVPDHPTQLS
ncbi:DeoR/GlpR family transcriptional regulator of sugar metabolism [Mycetocola sp. BIGb0189]|uniref:DeoR/GlpR family DNA-binding transcription regulator n=1 Tax=Mycetocola sp. BIGb0189 TaxID=2940604 RepID=UPI0021682B75|nr:DeoR/GlpR family DNA-binding transcription regulator [Mycetocola sp. BIGb0189]MCS4276844.1 DeoR/GlpR family transcriptional regulator of sugar metabolism [Mycetocola sp. BIGb0189]